MAETTEESNREPIDTGPRQVSEPSESRTGIAKFLGLSLGLWTLVIILAVVFLAIILVFAL